MKLQVLLQVLVLILLAGSTSHAQSEIDSLTALLKTIPKGTDKLELYKKACWYYIVNQPQLELATTYADSVKILSQELNNEKGKMTAIYYYGVIARYQGNYNIALKHLQHFLDHYQSLGDSVEIAKGLFHVGVVNIYLGNFDKSLALFYRNLAIEEKLNNQKNMAHVLNAIGGVYKETKKLKEAVDMYNQAGNIYKTLGLQVDYARCLQNAANSYLSLQNYTNALKLYQESIQIFEAFGNKAFVAYGLGNLGNLYEAIDKYEQALSYHQRALVFWRKSQEKRSLANCLNNIGKCYLKLKKYDQADTYLQESMQVTKSIKANTLLLEVYSNINQLHVARKDFEKAYHFYTLSNQVKDSIYNEINTKQVNELQAKYETAEKDKQIAMLAKQKEAQQKEASYQSTLRKAFSIGLILVSLLTVLSVYVLQQRLKNQKLLSSKNDEIKEATFKRQLIELEMKALRAQINPHCLFNCMNSINRMVLAGETDTASLYLTKFSKLVRLILENAETTTVSLENELALLESYIQLEELRFKSKISYHISVDSSIEPESTYMPSMVLQPFVENAIWHGLMHKDSGEKGVISISVREEDDQLLCTIEDNGVGREKAAQLREKSVLKSKSMGIKITQERLSLLNPKRLEELVRITDLKDAFNHTMGTRVEINIPIS